ncbi:Trm112 family protein [Micromonospora sp. NPDC049301]|uniref:Trm112 family protein n=1 Tax=Micromonospora sp. NPDC049301 TaxID=3155723 RepID=UPI00343C7D1F
MHLDQELLDVLCCPADHGDLSYSPEAEELRCDRCALAYPVRDGIPVLLMD